MSFCSRLLIPSSVMPCLVACAASTPEYTAVPVTNAPQLQEVQTAIHPRDVVFVTTRTDAMGSCQVLKIVANGADDTMVYGEDDHHMAVHVPIKDIASLEIYRPVESDPGPQWGLSKPNAPGGVGFLVVDLAVIAVQVPYYGIKYGYEAVQKQLDGPGKDPSHGPDAVPPCADPKARHVVPVPSP